MITDTVEVHYPAELPAFFVSAQKDGELSSIDGMIHNVRGGQIRGNQFQYVGIGYRRVVESRCIDKSYGNAIQHERIRLVDGGSARSKTLSNFEGGLANEINELGSRQRFAQLDNSVTYRRLPSAGPAHQAGVRSLPTPSQESK